MPLFVCDKCKAIENTALGHYWWSPSWEPAFKDETLRGKKLCSECMPAEYADGSPCERGGKWHNQFEKKIATVKLIEEMGTEHFIYTSNLDIEPTNPGAPNLPTTPTSFRIQNPKQRIPISYGTVENTDRKEFNKKAQELGMTRKQYRKYLKKERKCK